MPDLETAHSTHSRKHRIATRRLNQARRTTTYAIRLAVEGGGQVKAELVSVGQSGEQSFKRIESTGDRASGGLKGVGRQAELLRTGIRTLAETFGGGRLAIINENPANATLADLSITFLGKRT